MSSHLKSNFDITDLSGCDHAKILDVCGMRFLDSSLSQPKLPIAASECSLTRLTQKSSKGFMPSSYVLDSRIDAVSMEDAIQQIVSWASQRQSRYVALCNVHSVVTASQNPGFRQVINQADLALPDGAPIAWALRQSGHSQQERINGPDLTWNYLATAEKIGHSVCFYGSTEATLRKLESRILKQFPKLRIVGMISPPFCAISQESARDYIDQINNSGANVLFVGLGCPKQEAWMAAHRGKIHAVMLGVGAAFDYHAGTIQRAPKWVQKIGMEWAHRLISEPRRLAKRYAVTNSVFNYRMLKSMLVGKRNVQEK